MTLQEASQRFCISMESLQLYVENGLLAGTITENGISDYKEDDLRRAVQFRFLLKAGMDAGTLKRLIHLTETEGALAEQINLLRKCRYQLLEEIHGKQKCLDELDYYIHEMKRRKKEA